MEGRRFSNAYLIVVIASLMATSDPSNTLADEPLALNANHELIGWVPYNPASSVSLPSIALPDGTTPLPYGATLVNYDDNEQKRFVLSLATHLDLDHRKLRLIARDEEQKPILGVTFSVFAAPGVKQQTITFIGVIPGDRKELKSLLIVSAVEPKT